MTIRDDVRPSAEQLYDNLDAFFPNHDLDKPILVDPSHVANAGSPSSPKVEQPLVGQVARSSAGVAAAAVGVGAGKVGRQKSIRHIVKDRRQETAKHQLVDAGHGHSSSSGSASAALRVVSAVQAAGAVLLRRKSTKLWGNRVEEVTPSQERGPHGVISVPSILESPSEENSENCAASLHGLRIGSQR